MIPFQTSQSSNNVHTQAIDIAAFLPNRANYTWFGYDQYAAVNMAIQDINGKADILQGYHLRPIFQFTHVSSI